MGEGYPRPVTTESLLRVDPDDFARRRDAVAALDARVLELTGHEAVGDNVWRDFAHPGADSVGYFLDGCAYVHVTRGDRAGDESWTASLVRTPDARDAATTSALLHAAVSHAAAHGARAMTAWVF